MPLLDFNSSLTSSVPYRLYEAWVPEGHLTFMIAGLSMFLKVKTPVLETLWSRPTRRPTSSSRTSVPVKPSGVRWKVMVMQRLLVLYISITYHRPSSCRGEAVMLMAIIVAVREEV